MYPVAILEPNNFTTFFSSKMKFPEIEASQIKFRHKVISRGKMFHNEIKEFIKLKKKKNKKKSTTCPFFNFDDISFLYEKKP